MFVIYIPVKSQEIIDVETNIETVKISLQGAEIIREKELILPTGRSRIVFNGLSTKINAQSIQVTATNDVQVLSVVGKINFLANQKQSLKVIAIKDSINLISLELQNIQDFINAFSVEEALLKQNLKIGGNNGTQVSEVEKGADFYRKRFREIYKERSELNQRKSKINIENSRLKRQLNELNAGNRFTSEIEMVLSSKTTKTTKIRLRYVVNDAGWSPVYDLKATDLNQPINLKYRALAYNNTGVDWKDVNITLSTADPNASATAPTLQPWTLNFNTDNFAAGKGRFNLNNSNVFQQSTGRTNAMDIPTNPGTDVATNIRFETIEIAELNTDFEIKEPYTIPSDRKPYSIDVNSYDLDANFSHISIPKLDKDAFLLAKITGWENLDLIDGPMNVYYGESYIGLSNLSTRTLNDTLDLSLGRDKKVLVTRVKLKDFTKKQILGASQRVTYSFKISVKNNRSQTIEIDLEDQIPVSTIKEIEVDVKELSKGKLYNNTGKVKWKMNLQPGEKKSVILTFSIKYPKNKQVKMEQKQQKIVPRYF
jgi:uncharacterized protein (TIGR02231 family)